MKVKSFPRFVLFFVVALLVGCANLNTQTTSTSPVMQSTPGQPHRESSSSTPVTAAPVMPVFYDFKDVPVPPNFVLVDKESSVLQTSNFKTGVLVFKGRANYNSVVDFYMNAMLRENWKLKGSSRYSHSIMVFEKPERICVINVYPKFIYTYLEIYVLPTHAM